MVEEHEEIYRAGSGAGSYFRAALRLWNDHRGGFPAGGNRLGIFGQKLNRKMLKKPWDLETKSGIMESNVYELQMICEVDPVCFVELSVQC